MRAALALLAAGALAGCALVRHPAGSAFIPTPGGEVRATTPADPATPAAVSTNELPIPAGSPVEIRRESIPQPATTADPSPAPRIVETVTVTPSAATVWRGARAESGTQRAPDKRTELRAEDNKARAPLIWAGIAAAVGSVAFVFLRYPSPALLCVIASAGFLAAWKISGLPDWFWTVGAAAVAVAVGLYLGHEAGEKFKHRNAASVPT